MQGSIADDLSERETVFDTVRRFYKLRSGVAHGALPQDLDDPLVPAVYLARLVDRYCELAASGEIDLALEVGPRLRRFVFRSRE